MITTLSGALVISILVSLVKSLIEAKVPQGTPQHDTAIRLTAVLFGVAGYILHAGIVAPLSAAAAWDAAQQGLIAAVTAIAAYHLTSATGGYFATGTLPAAAEVTPAAPAAPASAPAQPQASGANYSAATLPAGVLPPAQ